MVKISFGLLRVLLFNDLVKIPLLKDEVSTRISTLKDIKIVLNEKTLNIKDVRVVNGINQVFEYVHFRDYGDRCYKAKWSESIIFTIDGEVDQFEFYNEEIKDTSCYYIEKNIWGSNIYQINRGSIIGQKIRDIWNVELSIHTLPVRGEQPKRIQFSEVFRYK